MIPWIIGLLSPAALAGDMDFSYTPTPGPDEQPAFMVTPARPLAEYLVVVEAGDERYEFTGASAPAGEQMRFSWDRNASVTSASVFVRGVFSDGYVEEVQIPIEYSYGTRLSVDLSRASADLAAHTLTVSVTAPVDRAELTAYGARRSVLEQGEVAISGGPGDITIPWAGDAAEVVLLDVKVYSGGSWAGFTFSPWFLDIPHDDVHFESNQSDILPEEEWKLEATLRQLQDVLDKYGEMVPVKVYIAGCTDTAGDAASNRDLSLRRARAIATWLRGHGYSEALYYHGFGEGFLAERTGDGVDSAANRRVLYMVGANPPPASTGVPQVSWREL